MNQDEIIQKELSDFLAYLLPFGSGDLWEAMKTGQKVGLDGKEIAKIVTDWCDETETKIEDADVCGILYDHILQQARNAIEKKTQFDIQNDANFYTYYNYMCSTFDYDSDDLELVKTELKKLSSEELNDLIDDDFVKFFLDEIDLLKEFKQ